MAKWRDMSGSFDGADVLVRGGMVLDPAIGVLENVDVAIRAGRIAAIGPDLDTEWRREGDQRGHPADAGTAVIDASGAFVTPGLIDLHTHVYAGVVPIGVPVDQVAGQSGVTTMVSAGDAGASTLQGLRKLVVEPSATNVLAFLHVSNVGLAGWPVGESVNLDYLNPSRTLHAIEAHRDLVVGIKVRLTAPIQVGENGIEPLLIALEVAKAAGLPVMVHIGGATEPLAAILELLRPGDIVTHCFTSARNGMLDAEDLAGTLRDARERGILFDVGHGTANFSYRVMEMVLSEGFWPDTISSDVHSVNANGPVHSLTSTMSKFLDLGWPFESVVRAVTAAPAHALGRPTGLGALEVGCSADLAILKVERGRFRFEDSDGEVRYGDRRIRAKHTIRRGQVWGGPYQHPFRPR